MNISLEPRITVFFAKNQALPKFYKKFKQGKEYLQSDQVALSCTLSVNFCSDRNVLHILLFATALNKNQHEQMFQTKL